jgi:hypothetical protein
MASRESEALKTLYRSWAAALTANPEMSSRARRGG